MTNAEQIVKWRELRENNETHHGQIAQMIDMLEQQQAQIGKLESYILNQNKVCPDAPKPLSDYCDMMHVCDKCKARQKAVEFIKQLKNGGEL